MRGALISRLERLEATAAGRTVVYRYGFLKALPNDFAGARHVVIVKRESTGSPYSVFGRTTGQGNDNLVPKREREAASNQPDGGVSHPLPSPLPPPNGRGCRTCASDSGGRFRAAPRGHRFQWPETTKMISRSLSRRLERLETSIMPTSTTSDPVVIELKFVSPEKVVTGSMSLKVDLPAPPSQKRQGRR
jgi:hypothetical protein